MTTKVNLDHIVIILVQPQIPENIGSAARAMNNMGLSRLVLVDPKNCDLCRVLKTATRTTIDLIEQMAVYENLKDALGHCQYVVGTTARLGSFRPAMTRPGSLAEDLIAISKDNRVAILFGPEDRGLSNEQLRYCHTIATIPTATFSSLNLAQAVMIVCYEIFKAASDNPPEFVPRLPSSSELEGMYDHLNDVLMKIGFLDPKNPEHWMRNIRRFFSRLPLRARDVRIVRGICRQIDWYTQHLEKIKREKKQG